MTPTEALLGVYMAYGVLSAIIKVYNVAKNVYKLKKLYNIGLRIFNIVISKPGNEIMNYYTREECGYPESDLESESEYRPESPGSEYYSKPCTNTNTCEFNYTSIFDDV